MEEEENPFRTENPTIDPLVADLNASMLSAERQKSNIISNPWESSEGDDILKSIMDINKNKKPESPPPNSTMYPVKNDTEPEIKFETLDSFSTPNFGVNDPWASPPRPANGSGSAFNTTKKKSNDFSNFTTININTEPSTSDPLNTMDLTTSLPNSAMLTSTATTNTSQSSIKSPINYMNTSQSLIATTSYMTSAEDADVITVRISPEKGGVVFKHVNYLIHSKLHKVSSIRRYSDFLWLYEVLCKRYQFRIMISMPPKHIGTSTNDLVFLEKRRRGLSRFINYVANHPIMKNDEYYRKFLDKEVDIYDLRKNTNLEITEEYETTYLTSEDINVIPIDFDKNVVNLRSGLAFLIEQYQALYNSMETISKNIESSSNEYTNIGYSLGQMSEFKDFLGLDTYNFKLLYNGYARLADGFQKISSVLHENYQDTLNGIAESLQTQREILEGFNNLLVARDAITSKININLVHIEKRVNATMERLLDENLKGKDKEKLELLVTQDQKDISALKRKLVFIRYSVFCETNFLEAQKFQIANMYSEYIQLQMRISSMLHDEWKLMSVTASKLPVGSF